MDERIGKLIEAKDVDGLLSELEEHELTVPLPPLPLPVLRTDREPNR